jgi:hypothetical protein
MRPRPTTLAELRRDVVAAAGLLGAIMLGALFWSLLL